MTPQEVYSPPALHFLIVAFNYSCGVFNCEFTCTTDVPCHLFAHVSPEKPIIRRIPYQKRGANFELSSVTCFVEVDTVEQDEAGDTTAHTFQIPFPLYDHVYYWYLTGTQGAIPCKSISQIFHQACSKPTGPIPRCQAWDVYWASAGSYRCYWYSSCFQPVTSYNMTSCDIKYQNDNAAYRVCRDGQFELWTAAANGRPSVCLGIYYFTTPNMTPNFINEVNIPITPTLLTAGSQYAISYGFRDYYKYPRTKKVKFLFAYPLTCEYSVPPSRHVWIKRYDSGYYGRCLHLLQNWYTYSYDRNLWFKTHGTDA